MPTPALPFEKPRVILTHYHDEGINSWTWHLADENDWLICQSILGFDTAAEALKDARDAFQFISAMGLRFNVLFEDADSNEVKTPTDPALHALLALASTPAIDTSAFEPVAIPGEDERPCGDGFLVHSPDAALGPFGEDLDD